MLQWHVNNNVLPADLIALLPPADRLTAGLLQLPSILAPPQGLPGLPRARDANTEHLFHFRLRMFECAFDSGRERWAGDPLTIAAAGDAVDGDDAGAGDDDDGGSHPLQVVAMGIL